MNSSDFYLWRNLKIKIYSNYPDTLNELKHNVCAYGNITNTVDSIRAEKRKTLKHFRKIPHIRI
jgi:hypothetical protein